jgi:hypothetical protein
LSFYYHFAWKVIRRNDGAKDHFNHALSLPIPLESIKAIKNHFGVSFAGVLQSVMAGIHQKMLIQKGFKVPKTLPCWMTVSLPGHSLKLRNHM